MFAFSPRAHGVLSLTSPVEADFGNPRGREIRIDIFSDPAIVQCPVLLNRIERGAPLSPNSCGGSGGAFRVLWSSRNTLAAPRFFSCSGEETVPTSTRGCTLPDNMLGICGWLRQVPSLLPVDRFRSTGCLGCPASHHVSP